MRRRKRGAIDGIARTRNLREYRRPLHQIDNKQSQGDKRQGNRDCECPVGKPLRKTSAAQKYSDGLERALSHAAGFPFYV
jgi:hypothetical protein